MSRRTAGILLIVLGIIGSMATFYGLNLLFSDVANMMMSSISIDLVTTFPGLIISLDFILASIYVLRYVRRPEYKKRMSLLYCIILGVFSLIGVITTIISGVVVYGSLNAPYPFAGYMVICLVIHFILLGLAIGGYYAARKLMPEDPERRKMRVGYVCYTITLSMLFCFAYYRLGADLLAPVFIQWRTLYLTWPFYLAMLVPTGILVHTILYTFNVYRVHQKAGIIHAAICEGLCIVLCLTVVLIGMNNTQFISAISPVLPLERLAALPIDTIVFILFMNGFGIFELIYSIRYYKRHQGKAE